MKASEAAAIATEALGDGVAEFLRKFYAEVEGLAKLGDRALALFPQGGVCQQSLMAQLKRDGYTVTPINDEAEGQRGYYWRVSW